MAVSVTGCQLSTTMASVILSALLIVSVCMDRCVVSLTETQILSEECRADSDRLVKSVGSVLIFTANCSEGTQENDTTQEWSFSPPANASGCINVTNRQSEKVSIRLRSVEQCSGQYSYNCSSNSEVCADVCFVDLNKIAVIQSQFEISCDLRDTSDCLQHNDIKSVNLIIDHTPDKVQPSCYKKAKGVYICPVRLPGYYSCCMTIGSTNFTSSAVPFTVQIPPPVVTVTESTTSATEGKVEIAVGKTIIFNCTADLISSSFLNKSDIIEEYHWYFMSSEVGHNAVFSLDVTSINDAGIYTCRAKLNPRSPMHDLLNSSDYSSASISLKVNQPENKMVGPIIGAVLGALVVSLISLALVAILCTVLRSRARKNAYFSSNNSPVYLDSNLSALALPLVSETTSAANNGRGSSETKDMGQARCRKGEVVTIDSFPRHVKRMHQDADQGFEEEFQSLVVKPQNSYTTAKLACNVPKNRFDNIFPYDFCRVKLSQVNGVEGSDYINASYLDGFNKTDAYIAAQGPLRNTVGDFWRMVWENRLPTIVMLTDIMEVGRLKCEQYWPTTIGKSYEPEGCNLKVVLLDQRPFAEYQVKSFIISDVSKPDEFPLKVTHYHFTAWPDHGVPADKTCLIHFIQRVRKSHPYSKPSALLVHCSAGVGRSGTFIVLDSMMQRMKSERSLNVYDFVVEMRAKRPLMVQTEAQYAFVHDALEEFITCGDTAIVVTNLRVTINKLSKNDEQSTSFQNQFELLEEVSHKPSPTNCTDGRADYNRMKNRYPDIVPYNVTRVPLKLRAAKKGSDYINASFIDGYKHRRAYIATQSPLEKTVNDFWQMIFEYQSRVIVMLCQLSENDTESGYQYWPEAEGVDKVYGKLKVKFTSEKHYGDFAVRKFDIKEESPYFTAGVQESFQVIQYHHTQWPRLGQPPPSQSILRMVKSILKTQISTGNHTIVVLCNDGVGRTGSFITVCSQLERIKVEGVADVFQYIKASRFQRMKLVGSVEQYQFCHEVLADYVDSFDDYANFKDLAK